MGKTTSDNEKKGFFEVFLDELSRSSLTLIFLAIFSGLVLGGLLVIFTTPEIYEAFGQSFLTGLQESWKAVAATYSSLFIGSVGDPAKILAAFKSGDGATILEAANPFLESLVVSTPYILTGLALALGFQAGVFNIGAEGQLYMGMVMAGWAGWTFKGLAPIIHVPLALLVGVAAGAIWGFIPGWLKAKTGAHEVINTIMMNYVASNFIQYLVAGPFRDPNESYPKTPWIQESAHLYRFFGESVRFNIGFFIAIGMAFLIWYLLFKTTWGFELRTVGQNPNASKYAGINITRITIIAMTLSGALSGLAGAGEMLGVTWRQSQALPSGIGFDSIALALLANNHPLGVILTALLFGFMRSGSRLMQLRAGVPIDIISILQAFFIFFIAAPAIIRSVYRLKQPSSIEAKHQPVESEGK